MASRKRRSQADLKQPGEPMTANEQLLDALIRHQIGLLRFSGGTSRRLVTLLNASEDEIRATIRRKLRGVGRGLTSPASVRAMQELLVEVTETRAAVMGPAGVELFRSMRQLALAEPATLAGIVQTVVPVVLNPRFPNPERLRAIVSETIFEGQVLREHFSQLRRADARRIQQQIRMGMVQGESPPEISRRVVGSVALKGKNGVTEITRRQATMLTRTATIAVAAEVRREWTKVNEGILGKNLFVATLDDRTTRICSSLDGKLFPVDAVFPHLPLHWGERSQLVFTVNGEVIGKRPARRFTQRQLLREFTKANGLDPVTNRKLLPRGTKGKFDTFARRRMRELTGRTPASVSYETFLRRQSAANQDDILGKTKGRLFRRGGLPLEKFVDMTGREFTLPELASSDPAAFRRAGLDPEGFL